MKQHVPAWLLDEPLHAGIERRLADDSVTFLMRTDAHQHSVRIRTNPREQIASDRVSASIQECVRAKRSLLQRLLRTEPEDGLHGPDGTTVTPIGSLREGLVVRQASDSYQPQQRAPDVVSLGKHLSFIARESIGAIMRPEFTLSSTSLPGSNETYRSVIEPVLYEMAETMRATYGRLAHDGTPLSVRMREEMPYRQAYALRDVHVRTHHVISENISPFESAWGSPYHSMEFHDSREWKEGAIVEFCAHEMGHAFVGVGAPQHDPIQEAIARLNEAMMQKRYRGTLFDAPLAFEETAFDHLKPEILFGAPGWGVPEFAKVHTEPHLAHMLYAAYAAALLESAGNEQGVLQLFQCAIDDWLKEKPQRGSKSRMRCIPRIDDWLTRMDRTLPGFKKRYDAQGMYQPEHLLPHGPRLTWRELGAGRTEIAAVHIERNPRCFLPTGNTQELNVLFADILAMPAKARIIFPGGKAGMEQDFIGVTKFDRSVLAEVAARHGITLSDDCECMCEIEFNHHTIQKTFRLCSIVL